MSRQSPREVELLEICDYFEKVLGDGSRTAIASVLKLLSIDDWPYTPIFKEKGLSNREWNQSPDTPRNFYT